MTREEWRDLVTGLWAAAEAARIEMAAFVARARGEEASWPYAWHVVVEAAEGAVVCEEVAAWAEATEAAAGRSAALMGDVE